MANLGNFVRASGLGAALALGCGGGYDDTSMPIENVPPGKPLSQLTAPELQSVCDRATGIALERLPAQGTQITCGNTKLTIRGLASCQPAPPECPATVAQWQVCLPHLVDRIAADPCVVLQLPTPFAITAFVEATPECEGLGRCNTGVFGTTPR